MGNEVKLKDCPFCGCGARTPRNISGIPYKPLWEVTCCQNCCERTAPAKKAVIALWNTRKYIKEPESTSAYKVVMDYGDEKVTVKRESENMGTAVEEAISMVNRCEELLIKATVHNPDCV